MFRPGPNCPRAATSTTSACAACNAVVGAVIRRRVRSVVGMAASMSARALEQSNRFVAVTEGDRLCLPPLPDPDEDDERTHHDAEKALLCASSYLFSTCFIIRDAVEDGEENAGARSGTTTDQKGGYGFEAISDRASNGGI